MQNKSISRWKIISVGIFFTFISVTPALFAQDASQNQSATLSVDQQCASDLRSFLNTKGKEFLDAMDQHFQDPSSTTSLIPLASEKYSAYKKMARAQLELLKSQIGNGSTQATLSSAFSKCDQALTDNLFQMDTVLRDHIKRNSSAKRTFIMTSEYQRINDKLATLNREIGQLKGYFQVMNSKLENFIPKCVRQ